MNSLLFRISVTGLILMFCFKSPIHAQSASGTQKKLIHYWHFNATLPSSGAGGVHMSKIPADYSTLGHALVWYKAPGPVKLARDTGYMDNLIGDTINQRAGYAGCCSGVNNAIRTRNPSDSMEFLWYIPTTGYQNILLTYETEASSTASGMHRQLYDYSLDSGTTYQTSSLPVSFDSAGTAWGKVSVNLAALSGANNTGKLVFRIRYTMPDTSQSGNNRFDNITIEGDTISATSGIQEQQEIPENSARLFPNPALEDLTIHSPINGAANILLYNAWGQLLHIHAVTGQDYAYCLSGLPKGFYYIKLQYPAIPGSEVLLKFIKI
ncbi:MAG TPA: T9SS type A sorting domain-containing protein [Bacteroidia bacterium]|jgi:hypothetical protein|nr:T9SS type A sorting domain-containing protein [Bacteroidia bacterium]